MDFSPEIFANKIQNAYIKAAIERERKRVLLRSELLDTMGVSGEKKDEILKILKLLSI